MSTTFGVQHAFDVLESPTPAALPQVIAIVGSERFLKRLVVRHSLGGDGNADLMHYTGDERPWPEIAEELGTVSLFGTGPRRVMIHDADDLVARDRSELEAYVARPSSRGTLWLELQSLPSNTKLYRAIADHGWLIVCRPPEKKGSKSKDLDVRRMTQWLENWGHQHHGIGLSRDALNALVDLIGWEFGLLDQELAKLALFVERGGQVSADLVRQVVGGWRTQTTWDMLEAAADGDAATALRQLDQLLQGGESPQALFGSTAWFLRRFNVATRLVEQQERHGKRVNLQSALTSAGFRTWQRDVSDRPTQQLRQLSRYRAGRLFGWLLETDLALKGSHSSLDRGRWALEQLILRLAKRP